MLRSLSLRRFFRSVWMTVAIATFAIALVTIPNTAMADAIASPQLTVYRTPTCGCCKSWVENMEGHGFTIEDHVVEDVDPIKTAQGLPEPLASCHTAIVDGYVLEGHVPAEDIQRLLAERPPIMGLAVPGMPVGSPGMEMGEEVDDYVTVAFDNAGHAAVFAEHGASYNVESMRIEL